jgi:hypothetical protein
LPTPPTVVTAAAAADPTDKNLDFRTLVPTPERLFMKLKAKFAAVICAAVLACTGMSAASVAYAADSGWSGSNG